MNNSKNFFLVMLAVIISTTTMLALPSANTHSTPETTVTKTDRVISSDNRTIEINVLEKQKSALKDEIIYLLRDINLEESKTIADVNFVITNRNRIQVLDIECADGELCQKIKSRLENRKVATKLTQKSETFHIKFIFLLQ